MPSKGSNKEWILSHVAQTTGGEQRTAAAVLVSAGIRVGGSLEEIEEALYALGLKEWPHPLPKWKRSGPKRQGED